MDTLNDMEEAQKHYAWRGTGPEDYILHGSIYIKL